MARLYNLARMTTATTGTGTITLGAAKSGFLSFAGAGVQDGETVTYAIKEGTNSEIGRGVYTSSGTTLTRSVIRSTNSNTPISLSGNAEVFITPAAEDIRVAFKNLVRNPDFSINQRVKSGTISLSAAEYGHDGWKGGASGATYTISGGVVTISANSLKQTIEGSFIKKTGTYVLSWTGTAQGKIDSGSYSASGVTATLTAGSNATIEFGTGSVSNVQLELGSYPSEFEVRSPAVELLINQRYFSKSMTQAVAPADGVGYATDCVFGVGGGISTTAAYGPFVVFPAPMRAVPTVTLYRTSLGSSAGMWQYLGGWSDATAMVLPARSETGFLAQLTGTFTTGAAIGVAGAWTASAEL